MTSSVGSDKSIDCRKEARTPYQIVPKVSKEAPNFCSCLHVILLILMIILVLI